jgi:hypothetical protein
VPPRGLQFSTRFRTYQGHAEDSQAPVLSHPGDECYCGGPSPRLRPLPDRPSYGGLSQGLRPKSRNFAEQTPFDHFFNSDQRPSTCFIGLSKFSKQSTIEQNEGDEGAHCFAESWLKEIGAQRFATHVAAGSA